MLPISQNVPRGTFFHFQNRQNWLRVPQSVPRGTFLFPDRRIKVHPKVFHVEHSLLQTEESTCTRPECSTWNILPLNRRIRYACPKVFHVEHFSEPRNLGAQAQ